MLWMPRKHLDPKHPTFNKSRTGTKHINLRSAAHAHFCFYLTTKGGTYTCFAPAFIFRSCLISLMMHFRSLPVHLKWERRFRDSRHLSALLCSWKKETGQGLHKKRSFPSVEFKLKGVSILLVTQRHKSTQKASSHLNANINFASVLKCLPKLLVNASRVSLVISSASNQHKLHQTKNLQPVQMAQRLFPTYLGTAI